MTMNRLSSTLAMAICMALPLQVSADLFTVNSTADPAFGDPLNCGAGAPACTLRDALAAADQTALHDTVVFAVESPIYLARQLVVEEPVTIDGGGGTTVRVHQGYTVLTLPDVFGDHDPIQVVQPVYISQRPFSAFPMLELRGDGSVVENLILDGSITPNPADLGLARIDRDGDSATDFLLFTLDINDDGTGDRWPIAGGILASFEFAPALTGTVEFRGNELRYFADRALQVVLSHDAVITGNEIKAGAVLPPLEAFYTVDGIFMFEATGATVVGNEVTGLHRTGLQIASGGNSFNATVAGNQVEGSRNEGILIEGVIFGTIADNEVSGNGRIGIVIAGGVFNVTGNEVSGNGSDPNVQGGIALAFGGGHTVSDNETFGNSGFGIAIDRSTGNVVSSNDMHSNGGSGFVIINSVPPPEMDPVPFATANQIQDNEIYANGTGVVAGFAEPFPFGNLYQGNEIHGNLLDVLDFDRVCNDAWVNNTVGTAYAASDACIQ